MDFNRESALFLLGDLTFFQVDPVSQTLLTQWGAPGAIIVALSGTIIWLFRYYTGRIKEKDAEIARLNDRNDQQSKEANVKMVELIERILANSSNSAEALTRMTDAVSDLKDSIELNEKIIRLAAKNE